jgi:hypothetical protein
MKYLITPFRKAIIKKIGVNFLRGDREKGTFVHYWRKINYQSHFQSEILSFAGKWMELETIILSKVSQTQKTKNRMFSFI